MAYQTLAARVRSLYVYPVKSCRGIDLTEAPLAARGFAWDRHWMVVDARGRFVTQRIYPQLATVATALHRDGLQLSVSGGSSLTLPWHAGTADGPKSTVVVWNDSVLAQDCGDAAAAWFSELLGTPARLVRATEATRRQPAERWRGSIEAPVDFSDGFPLLVCSSESLADLAARLPEPLPMNRFRPNIVIEGLPAWREDEVLEIATDEVALRLAKPCTRCVITTRDQQTGAAGSDPLPALRRFRYDRELKGVTFGWNALITSGVGATLRVGDALRLRLREPPATPALT
jgi:uncharacterized protein YcbX